MQTQIIPICFITPNNFSHKAGDGVATRKHGTSLIHPALQANCGGVTNDISIRIMGDERFK